MDGLSDTAQAALKSVMELTGQAGLRGANFSFLRDQAAHVASGTLKHQRAWCAVCYSFWEPEEAHEPLLWRVAGVDICHVHGCRLSHVCPYCDSPQPLVAWPILRMFCFRCRKSLSIRQLNRREIATENPEKAALQQWKLRQVRELLQQHVLDGAFDRLPPRQFTTFLSALRSKFRLGVRDLGRLLGCQETVSNFFKPLYRASLPFILSSCATTRVDLGGMLQFPVEAAAAAAPDQLDQVRRSSKLLKHAEQARRNREKLLELKVLIEHWLSSEEPAIWRLCREVDLNTTHLYRKAPELVRRISEMRREFFEKEDAIARANAANVLEKLRKEHPEKGPWDLSRSLAKAAGCTYVMARDLVRASG